MTQDSTHHSTNSVVNKHFVRYQAELFLVLFIIIFAIIGLAACFGLSEEVPYISSAVGT